MTIFNVGVDCINEKEADLLFEHLGNLDCYMQELISEDGRVSFASQQNIVDSISDFKHGQNLHDMTIEIWPEDMDYDEADENGELDTISL